MVIAYDKSQSFKVKVSDEVSLTYRYLTARENSLITSLQDAKDNNDSDSQILKNLVEAVSTGLIGWTGITDKNDKAVKFNAKNIDEHFTVVQLYEIAGMIVNEQAVSEMDKKKSQ